MNKNWLYAVWYSPVWIGALIIVGVLVTGCGDREEDPPKPTTAYTTVQTPDGEVGCVVLYRYSTQETSYVAGIDCDWRPR